MPATVVSHYRILGKLGAGGMGDVYRAEATLLDRSVALKFIKGTRSADQAALDRFLREARMAAALNHPHVCTVHEIGVQDDEYFLVMELLDGEPLDKRLMSGPLRPQELFAYADQITDALQAAHAKGIVHRDIKPANIFITQRGEVKVLDFGLAKIATVSDGATFDDSRGSGRLTEPGFLVGTPGFISPEQLRGEPADVRSDIFCLGATLYEMATGQPAFRGASAAMMVDAVLHAEPAPASRVNPAFPQCCEAVLAKCLEKDPELRYQSVTEMRRDLLRARRDVESAANGSRPMSARLPRRSIKPLVAAAAVLIVAAFAVLWLRSTRPAPAGGAHLQQRTLTSNSPENPVYAAAISPDGKYVAYADVTGVFLRLLETGETHTIALPPGFCFR
jgi:eukaryotic-like serine/threonine-protein kinase